MPFRQVLMEYASYASPLREFAAGSQIYGQGDACDRHFLLLEGWIALSVLLDDGSCQILDFAMPGALLGCPLATDGMSQTAHGLTTVRIRSYPRSLIDELLVTDAAFAQLVCHQARLDEARAYDHLVNLSLRNARKRVAHLLLELYVRVKRHLPTTAGENATLPLTQHHIGEATGLTNVHVSRMLHLLRDQGIVRFKGGVLEILDPAALLQAADVAARPLPPYPETSPLERGWSDVRIDDTVSIPEAWRPLIRPTRLNRIGSFDLM